MLQLGELLGAGAYGEVYSDPFNPDRVIKRFRPEYDPAYDAYVSWVSGLGADAPEWVPKIYSVERLEEYVQVHMERLTTVGNSNTTIDTYGVLNYLDAVINCDDYGMEVYSRRNPNCEQYELISAAFKWSEEYMAAHYPDYTPRADLHQGNIMFRGDTLVVTDPFAPRGGQGDPEVMQVCNCEDCRPEPTVNRCMECDKIIDTNFDHDTRCPEYVCEHSYKWDYKEQKNICRYCREDGEYDCCRPCDIEANKDRPWPVTCIKPQPVVWVWKEIPEQLDLPLTVN